MKEQIQRKAVAYIPDYLVRKVLKNGLVLPEDYDIESASLTPAFTDLGRNAMGIVLQSDSLPHTKPALVLPALMVEDLGSHVAVIPWKDDNES